MSRRLAHNSNRPRFARLLLAGSSVNQWTAYGACLISDDYLPTACRNSGPARTLQRKCLGQKIGSNFTKNSFSPKNVFHQRTTRAFQQCRMGKLNISPTHESYSWISSHESTLRAYLVELRHRWSVRAWRAGQLNVKNTEQISVKPSCAAIHCAKSLVFLY